MAGPEDGLCYFDGEPCDCGAFDVCGECPRDTYQHDSEFMDEDAIEAAYYTRIGRGHDDETQRF